MTLQSILHSAGLVVVVCPLLLVLLLGTASLISRPLSEQNINRATQASVLVGLFASLTILVLMLVYGTRHVPIELGNWVVIEEQHYRFHLKFVFDRLSVPFAILTFLLCGTVGAFASRYLHRESGFSRFFLLYAFFQMGMIVSVLAGTIETLFCGWELVGLSSALLVAYFQERESPVKNGLRIWSIYRVADAAFLIAAMTMHHLVGEGDFAGMMGTGPWPDGEASMTSGQALFVGLLLLIAAAGKSGLIPFSGWLPRAMEGPTPSSAVFYGALSVHLGTYLLLRVSPILALSGVLSAAVIVLGLSTAILAAMAARVQTDIKSSLAFASLTQVGIITVEIGLGLHYIPLFHMIGHACLRTLQLLRAPTLLRDYRTLENAIGSRLPHRRGFWGSLLPPGAQLWFYRFAHERGYLDDLLDEWLLRPLSTVFRTCNALERRWTDFLNSSTSTSDSPTKAATAITSTATVQATAAEETR